MLTVLLGFVAVAGAQAQTPQQIVANAAGITTVAGSSATAGYGGDGGSATSALLNLPAGVAVDSSGNIYIPDRLNHRIRKIDASTRIISTIAGTGVAGYKDGAALSAQFSSPYRIAIDSSGNLYIADSENNLIRKLSNGQVTTYAGGHTGAAGTPTSVTLSQPTGVALDSSGNLYIAEYNGNIVRKVTTSTNTIATVAGTGTGGYLGDGGSATSAQLNHPANIAIDSSGNVYIADSANNVIRKVSAGNMTTFAGFGVAGYSGDGGAATGAKLNLPWDVAIDAAGNLFIADNASNRVRKVTSGIISTVAGTGTAGFTGDGGAATAAQINTAPGIALDGSGNLYIVDSNNNRIRMVTPLLLSSGASSVPAGATTTLAISGGSGTGAVTYSITSGSSNCSVSGTTLTASAVGSCVVTATRAADATYKAATSQPLTITVTQGSQTITFTLPSQLVFSGPGDTRQLTGSASSGLPVAYSASPSSVCTVSGSTLTYVSSGSCTVQATQSGNTNYAAATPVSASTQFMTTQTISFGSLVSKVYGNPSFSVSATASSGLAVQFSSLTTGVCTVSGTSVTIVAPGTCTIAADQSGNVNYAAATTVTQSFTVSAAPQWITAGTAGISSVAGTGATGFSGDNGPAVNAVFNGASGVAVDTSGNLYIVDRYNQRFRKVSNSGTITTIAGSVSGFSGDGGPALNAAFAKPYGVAIDSIGNMYIADFDNHRIRKIDTSGNISTIAGGGTGGDGPATSAQLVHPTGIAIDAAGNIYISEYDGNRVRKVTGGVISTVAGTGAVGYTGDNGAATSATFGHPISIAIDSLGVLYIADSANNVIRKVAAGVITTVAGTGTAGFSGDGGAATSAKLSLPWGVLVDAQGNLLIADNANNRIRKVTNGVITTVAGSATAGFSGDGGAATSAQFNTISGAIALDAAGNLYASGDNRVRKISPILLSSSPATVAVGAQTTLSTVGGSGTGAVTYAVTPASSNCSLSGNVVTGVNVGSCTVLATKAADTNYVAATSQPLTITVTQASQTITFPAISDVTYGVASFPLTATASSGLSVTLTSNTTGVCTVSGSTITIVSPGACSITASQPGNTNFVAATSVTQSFTVKQVQTITFPAPGNVSYGVAPFTVTATASSSLPVTLTSNTSSVCTVSGSTVTVLAIGTCSITATQPGNGSYAAATPVTQSFTVNPTTQTITFPALSDVTYGVSPFTVTATASSNLSVTLTSKLGSVCTVAGSTVTILAVGICSITATQPGNATYAAATPVTQSFTVNPVAQTITFAAISNVTYGAAPFTVTATASSNLSVTLTSTTTSVCAVSGSTVTILAGGTCSITATQPGNATYAAATPVTQSFTVNPATQTITFPALSNVTYGVSPFSVTATASSNLSVTLTSTTTSVCTVSGSTVTILAGGTCSITATQPGNANYAAATAVTQSFTANPAAQTITFPALSNVTYGVSPFSVAASASSNLSVTLTSTTTSVCTVSGSTVTILAGGTCSITATQLGNANYAAATPVTRTFTVNPATQTINFPAISNVTYGIAPFTLSPTASSNLPVTLTSGTPAVCTVSGFTVTIVGGGACGITASQAGNGSYTAAADVKVSFVVFLPQTITFPAISTLTYGAAPFSINVTATSNLPVTLTSTTASVCSVSGSTVTVLGAGTCSITATQPGNGSYAAATQVTQSFTVNPVAQTITFPALSNVTYGISPFSLTATASSNLSVILTSTTTSVCTVSGSTVTLLTAGACSITATQPGNANYSAAPQVSRSFTVNSAAQTIMFPNPGSVIYGIAAFPVNPTASSNLPVTLRSTTSSVCTVSGSTVTILSRGTCSLTASQTGNGGYAAAADVTVSFLVYLPQSLSFLPINPVTYGDAPFSISVTATSNLPVSLTSTTTSVCTVSGSTVTILAGGTCSITATQAGNTVYAAASPVTQSLTVNPATQTITFPAIQNRAYGAAPFTLTATASSGLPVYYESRNFICAFSQNTLILFGPGDCVINATQPGNSNYLPASATQTFTIYKAQQKIVSGTSGIHTFAGNGWPYHETDNHSTGDGGPATAASLEDPVGVATDGAGNVYIAEDYWIRKVDGNGIISTIYYNLSPTAYSGIAVDSVGNVFVIDRTYADIAKIPERASITVGWGAEQMAIDLVGNLYVASNDAYSNHGGLISKVNPSSGSVEIIAGYLATYGRSVDGGSAISAYLQYPTGVAVDFLGNVYIADAGDARIRKVNPAGIISTIAGTSGIRGYTGDNGPAVNALLANPTAVTADSVGNIYIADSDTHCIRRIDVATGTITNISAVPGYTSGLTVDASGNLYAVSRDSHIVSRITPILLSADAAIIGAGGSANLSASGGSGTGLTSYAITSGKSSCSLTGNVLTGNAPGTCTVVATNAGDFRYLPATSQPVTVTVRPQRQTVNFTLPSSKPYGTSLTLNANATSGLSVYFVSNTISVCTVNQNTLTFVNVGACTVIAKQDGNSTYAPASTPATMQVTQLTQSITFGALRNRPYGTAPFTVTVTVSSNLPVTMTSTTSSVCTVAGNTVTIVGPGTCFITATQPGNSLYSAAASVAQWFTVTPGQQQIANGTAGISTFAGTGSSGILVDIGTATSVSLPSPRSVAMDNAGNIYVADSYSIRKVAANGTITLVAGRDNLACPPDDKPSGGYSKRANTDTYCSGNGGFAVDAGMETPSGLAVDPTGNIYIADTGHNQIRYVTPRDGMINATAGDGTAGYVDGVSAPSGRLNGPTGLALDAAGNLYIADTGNHRIRRVNASDGRIVTVAGTGIARFSGDGGPASSASLILPSGIAIDPAGNIYIADSGNNRVRMINPTGIISTVAGGALSGSSGDNGLAVNAFLNNPAGLVLDLEGNLYIADQRNHRVRKITAATGVITTVAGKGAQGYTGDGIAASGSSLTLPFGVAIDGSGNLYVADWGNNRVRVISPLLLNSSSNIVGVGKTASLLIAGGSGTGAVSYMITAGSSSCTISGNTLTGVSPGTCSVIATKAGDANYTAANSQTVIFTIVGGQTQTIAFAPLSNVTYGVTPFAVTATSSSNLPVTFSSSTTQVCTVFGSTVTILTAGTCSITATQSGNAGYAAATPVTRSYNVLLSQSISLPTIGSQQSGRPAFYLSPTSTSGLPVTLSSSPYTTCSVDSDGSSWGVTPKSEGVCTITATQSGDNTTYAAAKPVSRTFTITGQTITFAQIPETNLSVNTIQLTASSSLDAPIAYSTGTPAVCVVSGATLTLLSIGNCTVTASQPGNGGVGPFAPVSVTFKVTGQNPTPKDVTSSLTISSSGLAFNRTTSVYSGTITVRNNSSLPIAMPLQLVLSGLPGNVIVFSDASQAAQAKLNGNSFVPSGNTYAGQPYVTAASGLATLPPGGSFTPSIYFVQSGTGSITYTPKVLSGVF